MVNLVTNFGAYYTPDIDPGELAQPLPNQSVVAATNLTLLSPPSSAAYLNTVTLQARLISGSTPLAGQTVSFSFGTQQINATTDSSGLAQANLTLLAAPGSLPIQATFAGGPGYIGTSVSSPLTLSKQPTTLTLAPATTSVPVGSNIGLVATLVDGGGRPLPNRTVLFVLTKIGRAHV